MESIGLKLSVDRHHEGPIKAIMHHPTYFVKFVPTPPNLLVFEFGLSWRSWVEFTMLATIRTKINCRIYQQEVNFQSRYFHFVAKGETRR